MLMLDPKKFLNKDDDIINNAQRDRANNLLYHITYNRTIFALSEILTIHEQIKNDIGIVIPTHTLVYIFCLYPQQKINIIQNGIQDTGSIEDIYFVVANFLGGTRWPTYGDNFTDNEKAEFIKRMQEAAIRMKFEVIQQQQ